MFEHEVRCTLEYVARGINVRIVGAQGSGRSTVAQRVVTELEKAGATVYGIVGIRSHRTIAFAGINSLGLDIRPGSSGVLAATDALAAELTRPGARVLVVDDVEVIDEESLAVLDAVQVRTRRPLVVTMSDSPVAAGRNLSVLGRWSEAQVQLNPLRYGQVNKLITATLGAPADADATARILTESAGNPRLVARIAETAALSNLLILREGQWHMTGRTLWNEHLHGTVEALLQGLETDELTGLHIMSIVGATPIDGLRQVVASDVFDRLERAGFISVTDDADKRLCAAITPPLVVEYFRGNRMLAGRRLLTSRIAHALNIPPEQPHDNQAADSLAKALATLKLERSADEVARVGRFREHVQSRERHYYQLWSAEKTASSAVAFLRHYWGAPIDQMRIERVFDQTRMSGADPGDHLFFVLTKALWTVYCLDDLSAAVDLLRNFGHDVPEWEPEAKALTLFLEASYDRMPKGLDKEDAWQHDRHPTSGVMASVHALLELYSFNPSSALSTIESASGFEVLPCMETLIRGLALLSAGRVEESLVFALHQRSEARREFDQFRLVSNSYVAVLALIHCGYLEEADYVLGSVFALGRPGFLVDSLHDAMLRISELRAATNMGSSSPSLAAHARCERAEIGPLPGTGRGLCELFARRPIEPSVFEAESVALINQQLDRGYTLEAVHSGLFALSVLPTRGVLEILRRTLKEHEVVAHDQLLAIAEATVDGDHQLLEILLERYEPDADLHQVHLLLSGASEHSLLEGEACGTRILDRAVSAFSKRFPHTLKPLSFSLDMGPSLQLTAREYEVAIMAGHRTNTEIASELGISIRTVENHISNALKKTQTTSRTGLHDLVRNSSSFGHGHPHGFS